MQSTETNKNKELNSKKYHEQFTKPVLNNVLSHKNKHPRDENIQFFEEGHKYQIKPDPTSKYTSVTTWNHSHFPHFDSDEVIRNMMKGKNWKEGHKYWGMTPETIKAQWNANGSAVSGAGTDMHFEIECFMNDKRMQCEYTHKELYQIYKSDFIVRFNQIHEKKSLEWKYFIEFVKDTQHLKPYRTEWTIYHEELKLAGSIDMVYENPDGTLSIYDWKRSKDITRVNNFNKYALTECICHMPDSNFWHYALQLNTYKAILEEKYGKKVHELYLVRLHPDNEEKSYELIKLPDLSKEIRELFQIRINELKNA
jgi:ATP-dependent exoDNAse (exonuclease V) beta subunit